MTSKSTKRTSSLNTTSTTKEENLFIDSYEKLKNLDSLRENFEFEQIYDLANEHYKKYFSTDAYNILSIFKPYIIDERTFFNNIKQMEFTYDSVEEKNIIKIPWLTLEGGYHLVTWMVNGGLRFKIGYYTEDAILFDTIIINTNRGRKPYYINVDVFDSFLKVPYENGTDYYLEYTNSFGNIVDNEEEIYELLSGTEGVIRFKNSKKGEYYDFQLDHNELIAFKMFLNMNNINNELYTFFSNLNMKKFIN